MQLADLAYNVSGFFRHMGSDHDFFYDRASLRFKRAHLKNILNCDDHDRDDDDTH